MLMLRTFSQAMTLMVGCALCATAGFSQQHTGDAPQMIEGPQAAYTPKPSTMNNDSVLKMVKSGLDEELVVQTIQTQPGQYVLVPDALVTLKDAGVSNRVLAAMMNKSRRQITSSARAPAPEKEVELSDVNEIGIYYKDRAGRWTLIEPELVHIKSGGFIKSTLTQGIIKQDRNGTVNGRESKLLLPRPCEFLIYVPEGVAASEYDLLRFRLHSDRREFRTFTGGVIHSGSGAERDEVFFKTTRVAPRTYQFTVDQSTAGGEYGILPPGTGNITNGGKIYTFAISE